MNKIIYFKALMSQASGYKIADLFNRQFSHLDTVSKTYVYEIIRKYQYQILILRKNIKNKEPLPVANNWVWGVDLTGKFNSCNKNMHILGIIDHGSRFNIVLKYIHNKSSKRLLFEIYLAVKEFGKPEYIRTDNEAVFKSRLFKLGLRLMGIKHQLTDVGCPWMNGRIERFFGTLKEKLNQVITKDSSHLGWYLKGFRFWYNHVRTHMNLDGRTPIEVWQNKGIKRHAEFYQAWDGLLQGYLHPLDG
ncbi:MAG: transposase family protein [Xanthomonadales bacterium]|nr:transposase family protein [Xanthomonadales bacterium]